MTRLRLVEGKLERENLLKKNALKRAREADAVGAKASAYNKAKKDGHVMFNIYKVANDEAARLALEVEDKVAELKELSDEVKELRGKMPKECQKAFDAILSGKGHEGDGRVWELSFVEMRGHKGEIYSQAIIELGFQLMAMRLTADQAVNVT